VDPFGTVLIAIAIVAAVAAAISFVGSGRLYRDIGRGELSLDETARRPGPRPGTAAHDAEARAELRQLLEAKSHRRQARGQAPLDVEAELGRLLNQPAHGASADDPALREEVRQLVVARNERRLRHGQEPLDVEAEIERQLRELESLGQ
jgi:hypothetical protein